MKLQKCNDHQEVPAFSEEDLLRAENEFLKDELEFREQEYTLELYETILDCIQKEGSVSKSLEVMFGENVSSISNFESEINAQYESALEGLLDFIKNIGRTTNETAMFSVQKKKAKELSEQVKKVKDRIEFPLSIQLTGIAVTLRSVILMIQHGSNFGSDKFGFPKYDQKKLQRIQSVLYDAMLGVDRGALKKVVNDTKYDDFYISNITELEKILDDFAHGDHLAISEDRIKYLLNELKELGLKEEDINANGYDDNKIKRLNDILLKGSLKINMQILRGIEHAINRAKLWTRAERTTEG